jgi:PAS domain S-box-containing protein
VLPLFAGLMVAAGLVLAALAVYVSWRRGIAAGISLAVLLLAGAWWCLAYAVELSTEDLVTRTRWGDLKYVGIVLLGPAWLMFVLHYTGRTRHATKGLLLALAVEPVILLTLLAAGPTHDLVRFYPESAAGQDFPVVGTGPVFWVHLAYTNALLLFATVLFIGTMARVSRVYWPLAAALVGAALLPWAANFLHNFGVGPFERIDLTPFAFVVTGGVLVWGLARGRLVRLMPVARGVVVEGMADAVFVLDAFRHVVDVNPAASRVLGRTRGDLIGRPLDSLFPHQWPQLRASQPADGSSGVQLELTLTVEGEQRYFDARRQPLTDRSKATAGELLVLRDITDRKRDEIQLHDLLAERTRVAAALQASLLPAALPEIAMSELAGLYEPAGDGSEIGGDFFDVFPIGSEQWGFVLGDVSGKGAEAAAITALTRYTLRTLASPRRSPSRTLRELNTRLLRESAEERYCTLIYGVARQADHGVELTVSLGGHYQPLVRREGGEVQPVGTWGTALGLVDDPELHDTTIQLARGEVFCMFTDGLVEARSGTEMFGIARISDVLRDSGDGCPHELVTALAAAARQFHGGQLGDDLALLVLRVRAAAPLS